MSKTAIALLLAVALGLAACGGGSTGATAGSQHAPSGTLALARSRPTHIYTAALSGRAEITRGAARGRGFAIIAFHGDSLVCWRFAHLHGFINATGASLLAGRAGRLGTTKVGLSSGPRLHHQGCRTISPALAEAIFKQPGGYYVNVLGAGYPRGAVRAQL